MSIKEKFKRWLTPKTWEQMTVEERVRWQFNILPLVFLIKLFFIPLIWIVSIRDKLK